MSFKEIGDALETKMIEMKIATTKVAEVYNYEIKQTNTYPYIVIVPADGGEIVFDQVSNEVVYPFMVRLVVRNKTIATTEDRARLLADEMLIKLREMQDSVTLTSGCVYKLEWTFSWGRLSDAQEPQRVFTINVVATASKPY